MKSLDKRTSEGQKDVSIRVYAGPILKSLCRERRKYIPGMGKSEIAKESQKMLESPWMAGYIRMEGGGGSRRWASIRNRSDGKQPRMEPEWGHEQNLSIRPDVQTSHDDTLLLSTAPSV